MGSGHFTAEAYETLRATKGYENKSREQIFSASELDPEMDPRSVHFRESRDSAEHPASLPIIVGLDVTGSMGFVPELIVKESLPDLVGTVISAGIPDPQVLFLGIGDFVYDRAPLQVGQFESSAELLDRWLTKVFLEGGGGPNGWESYTLAWLLAARHTRIDSFEKRSQKGFLFTIGDEPVNPDIPGDVIRRLTADPQAETLTSAALLAEVRARYHVYHIHVVHGAASGKTERQAGWRDLLGQDLLLVDDPKRLARLIAQTLIGRIATDRAAAPQVPASPLASLAASTPVEDML